MAGTDPFRGRSSPKAKPPAGIRSRVGRAPQRCAQPPSICFDERILMLGVAHDQRSFAVALVDDKLPAVGSRVDRDERRGLVAVTPRADHATPSTEVEGCGAVFGLHA